MCELKTNNCFQCSRWNNNYYALCIHLDRFNRKDVIIKKLNYNDIDQRFIDWNNKQSNLLSKLTYLNTQDWII